MELIFFIPQLKQIPIFCTILFNNKNEAMDRKLEHLNLAKLKSFYTLETQKDPDENSIEFHNWALLKTTIASHNLLIDILNAQNGNAEFQEIIIRDL